MSGLARLFKRPRLASEVSFALGAAVVMGFAGALVALGTPSLRPFPWASRPLQLFLDAGIGFGLAWWGGLMWSVGLAFHARRFQPPPPTGALMRATWLAAALFAVVALGAHDLGASGLASVGGGAVICTLAARAVVTSAAGRHP